MISTKLRAWLILGCCIAAVTVAAASRIWPIATGMHQGWSGLRYHVGEKPSSVSQSWTPGGICELSPDRGPAARAGIRVGDVVVGIDGFDSQDASALGALQARARVGDTLSYELRRGDSTLVVPVVLASPLSEVRVVVDLVIDALVGMAFLIAGVFVFWKRPGDRRAVVLCLLCTSATLFVWSDWFPPRGLLDAIPFTSEATRFFSSAGVEILLYVLFLHLTLVFPRERPAHRNHPRLLLLPYAIPTVLFLLATIVWLGADTGITFNIGYPVRTISEIVILAFPIASCVSLYRSYRESGPEEKRQVRWPIWGTVVGIAASVLIPSVIAFAEGWQAASGGDPPLVDTFHQSLIGGSVLSNRLVRPFILLIPLSFAFGILKYRLMEIDLVIKRTIVYGLITIIVVAFYLILVGGVGGMVIQATGVESDSVKIAATLVVAAAFIPVRNRVQLYVNRRLFRRRYTYAEILEDLRGKITGLSDQTVWLRTVAEKLQQALWNRSVVIFLRGGDELAFWARASIGLPDELVGHVRIEIAEQDLSGAPSVLRPELLSLSTDAGAGVRRTGAALLIAMGEEARVIGLIGIGKPLSNRAYEDEDLEFMKAVAELATSGFMNLSRGEQQKDFEKAREIQEGLLPKVIPQIAGYDIDACWIPARIVSGDYFDVWKVDADHLVICIGDVAGKGMGAALLMSNLQATIKAFATTSLSPAYICQHANRVLAANLAAGKFITFFYAVLECGSQRLRYTNCGHNPPLLFRGREVHCQLDTGGTILGVFESSSYEEGEVQLCADDRLVLFTDGVTEAMDVSGEEFGEDRLRDFVKENEGLSAKELRTALGETLSQFSAGERHDDLTLIIVDVY